MIASSSDICSEQVLKCWKEMPKPHFPKISPRSKMCAARYPEELEAACDTAKIDPKAERYKSREIPRFLDTRNLGILFHDLQSMQKHAKNCKHIFN